jgi:putative glycosyltransferase (TIGR04372 family)
LGDAGRSVGRRIVIGLFLRETQPPPAAPPPTLRDADWRSATIDRTDARSEAEWIALFAEGRCATILESFGGRDQPYGVLPKFSVPGEAAARYRAVVFSESLIGRISDRDVVDRVLRTRDVLLSEAGATAPAWAEVADWRAINWYLMGDYERALDEFARADALRERMAATASLEAGRAVYLPRSCAFSIGLMCHLDGYVKRKILAGDQRPYILLAASGSVVNLAYLEYWQDHVEIVSDPASIAACEGEEAAFAFNWNWVLPSDGSVARRVDVIHRRIAAVQREWQAEGRPPLLTLKNAHRAALDAQKRAWGMTDDDWFVCFHIRSAGFYKEAAGGANEFRNTAVEDYYPAMRLVTEMGGWAIRMGDSSMPPLDVDRLGERVIDYACRPEKSAVLDVALCAACRLFVASPSGLSVVAGTFGRPCALVNYPLQIGIPWFPADLFTFKRVYSSDRKRYLSLDEVFSSSVPAAITQHLLDRANVVLHDNDPTEIAELVREALLGDGYAVPDPAAARAVQAAFDTANARYNVGISARLGRHFAVSHAPELLGRSEANALPR